jgi:tripartite-type tricarboxylate transporter receptor subunit TctC
LVLDKMSTALKQPFVVENKPGAGGNIAAEMVAKSAPDGYTLLFAIDTTFTVNPSIYKALPFDPAKDFAVISVPVTYGQLLAVHPRSRRTRSPSWSRFPSRRNYVCLWRQRHAQPPVRRVLPCHRGHRHDARPLQGHRPVGDRRRCRPGRLDLRRDDRRAAARQVRQAARPRHLERQALGSCPEIPTIAESFPGFEAAFAYAFMAPAGTSVDVVKTLNRETLRALAQPDVQEKNRTFDYVATGLDPSQSAAWLKDNRDRWAQVIKRAGIMME